MRIEDRPKKKFLSDSSKVGLTLVGFWTAICIMFGFLFWAITDEIPSEEYGMHPEPIQTVFEEEVEILTDEVVMEQEAPLISEDELIAKVVMAEAGTEPFVGQVAVAATILNRAEQWDMTVYEVLTQPNQYASPAYIVTEECYKAVEFARANRDLFPEDMMYFRTKHYHKFGEPYAVIGSHYFSTGGK